MRAVDRPRAVYTRLDAVGDVGDRDPRTGDDRDVAPAAHPREAGLHERLESDVAIEQHGDWQLERQAVDDDRVAIGLFE
jgi:hypothetical protein